MIDSESNLYSNYRDNRPDPSIQRARAYLVHKNSAPSSEQTRKSMTSVDQIIDLVQSRCKSVKEGGEGR